MRSTLLGSCVLVIATVGLVACGQSTDTPGASGHATGATCPQGSELTYETFAHDFMESYCTRCHASSLRSADRQGAPSDHNFDTLAGLRATPSEHIDELAAAGPDVTNTAMPPTAPTPSDAERQKLGEWLACGMR
jgi:uncharacterized membrane protein